MTYYHVNPETGAFGRCVGPDRCNYKAQGIDAPHFTSQEEARVAGEAIVASQHQDHLKAKRPAESPLRLLQQQRTLEQQQEALQEALRELRGAAADDDWYTLSCVSSSLVSAGLLDQHVERGYPRESVASFLEDVEDLQGRNKRDLSKVRQQLAQVPAEQMPGPLPTVQDVEALLVGQKMSRTTSKPGAYRPMYDEGYFIKSQNENGIVVSWRPNARMKASGAHRQQLLQQHLAQLRALVGDKYDLSDKYGGFYLQAKKPSVAATAPPAAPPAPAPPQGHHRQR